jgi:IS605 OrfB family transposase
VYQELQCIAFLSDLVKTCDTQSPSEHRTLRGSHGATSTCRTSIHQRCSRLANATSLCQPPKVTVIFGLYILRRNARTIGGPYHTRFQVIANSHTRGRPTIGRETQAGVHAVAIDPGVRTPFTWYSPTKGVGKIGQYDIGRIIRLCQHMDNLISRRDKLALSSSKRKQNKARRLGAALARMQRRVSRLQSEVHKKTTAFFTREFDVIVIPPFEVSQMVNRKTRKIRSRTVRQMLCWAHYRFRQRLISKAEELGVHVVIQNEAYTAAGVETCRR